MNFKKMSLASRPSMSFRFFFWPSRCNFSVYRITNVGSFWTWPPTWISSSAALAQAFRGMSRSAHASIRWRRWRRRVADGSCFLIQSWRDLWRLHFGGLIGALKHWCCGFDSLTWQRLLSSNLVGDEPVNICNFFAHVSLPYSQDHSFIDKNSWTF